MTDYWVLDVKERHLHVFREPSPEGYQSEVTITEEDSISPLQFPTITIPIGQNASTKYILKTAEISIFNFKILIVIAR